MLVYFVVFTGPSAYSHPTMRSVDLFFTGEPPNLVVGAPQPLGESEMPYGQALATFVNLPLVAGRAVGWPEEAAVLQVLARDTSSGG